MKATNLKPGELIALYSIYRGTVVWRKVLHVSPKATKITVERLTWATGKEELIYQPSSGLYKNDYAAETFQFTE